MVHSESNVSDFFTKNLLNFLVQHIKAACTAALKDIPEMIYHDAFDT